MDLTIPDGHSQNQLNNMFHSAAVQGTGSHCCTPKSSSSSAGKPFKSKALSGTFLGFKRILKITQMKPRPLFKVYKCNPASQQSECFLNISGLGLLMEWGNIIPMSQMLKWDTGCAVSFGHTQRELNTELSPMFKLLLSTVSNLVTWYIHRITCFPCIKCKP